MRDFKSWLIALLFGLSLVTPMSARSVLDHRETTAAFTFRFPVRSASEAAIREKRLRTWPATMAYYLDSSYTGGVNDGSLAHPFTVFNAATWAAINGSSGLTNGNVVVYLTARQSVSDQDAVYASSPGGTTPLAIIFPGNLATASPNMFTIDGISLYDSTPTSASATWVSYGTRCMPVYQQASATQPASTGSQQSQLNPSCAQVESISSENQSGQRFDNVTLNGIRLIPTGSDKDIAVCGDNWLVTNNDLSASKISGTTITKTGGPMLLVIPNADDIRQGSASACAQMHNLEFYGNFLHDGFGEGFYLGGAGCAGGMLTDINQTTGASAPFGLGASGTATTTGSGFPVSSTITQVPMAGGNGLQINYTSTAGVVDPSPTIVTNKGGSFYLNGTLVTVPGGGVNAVFEVTNEVGGTIQPGGLTQISGGSGYPSSGSNALMLTEYLSSGVNGVPPTGGFPGIQATATVQTNSSGQVTLVTIDLGSGNPATDGYNPGANYKAGNVARLLAGNNDAVFKVSAGTSVNTTSADSNAESIQCTNFNSPLPWVNGQIFPSHTGIKIHDNEIFRIGSVNDALQGTSQCLAVGGGQCSGQGDGVDMKGGLSEVHIYRNNFHDSLDVDAASTRTIVMEGQPLNQPPQNILFYQNISQGNVNRGQAVSVGGSWGIPGGVIIANNILTGGKVAGGISLACGVSPCEVANNTIFSYVVAGLIGSGGGNPAAPVNLQNNIILDTNVLRKTTFTGGSGYPAAANNVPLTFVSGQGTGGTINYTVSANALHAFTGYSPGFNITAGSVFSVPCTGVGCTPAQITIGFPLEPVNITLPSNAYTANNNSFNGGSTAWNGNTATGTCPNPNTSVCPHFDMSDADLVSPSSGNFTPTNNVRVVLAGLNLTSLATSLESNTPGAIVAMTTDYNGVTRPSTGAWDTGAIVYPGGGTIATTTTVSASPTTVTYGTSQTFTATVLDNTSTPVTGGTVTFQDLGGGFIATGVSINPSNGQASVSGVLQSGTRTVRATYNPSGSYITSSGNTTSLTVSKASLTLTADNKTGQFCSTIVYTGTYSGFVNGDTSLVVSGTPTFSNNATMTGMCPNVGVWSIIPAAGTATATNYNVNTFVNGVLTITPAPTTSTTTTVTGPGATTYGSTQNFTATVLDVNSVPVTGGTVTFTDTTSGSVLITANATINGSGQAAGSGVLQSGTRTITATYNPSSSYTGSSGTTTATVNQTSLTATADNKTVQFGTKPLYSGTLTGFVNGDNSSSVSGSLTFSTNATMTGDHPNVGTWVIIPALGTVTAANYTVGTFVNGILTVTPAAPISTTTTVTNSGTVTYGANQTFTATVLDNTLNPVTTGTVTFTDTTFGSITIANNVALNGSGQASTMGILQSGSRTVTATYNPSSAYLASAGNTTAIVNKATLTLTANNVTIRFGQLPTYTGVYSGFVNGDTSAVVSGTPAYSNNATMSGRFPNVGTWTITPAIGSATSPNYNISTFVTGVLIVTPAPLNNIQGQLKP